MKKNQGEGSSNYGNVVIMDLLKWLKSGKKSKIGKPKTALL